MEQGVAEPPRAGQRGEHTADLDGQFARRNQDQCLDRADARVGALDERQEEREGLA